MVRVDDAGLSMRRIRQRLAEQAFGRSGIAQAREHEVDRGAGGIDGSVEVAPTTLDTNVGLIDTPGLIGWLEMTVQPRLQFGTVALDPALDCRVVRLETALAEQLFNIAERQRVPQVPAHGTKNQLGLGLSPLEDRRSDCLFHDLFRLPVSVSQSSNTTPVAGRPTDPDGWDRIYEGFFLEAVLVTQLSGDFSGPVLANVSVPFYSADRQRVLIPRGARVVGSVEAVAGADQERLAVAFHRLIWPDGRSVSLEFNGLNQIGESALKDAVDRHYFSMFAAAGAVGILSGLTAIGSNPYAGGRAGFQAVASQGLGEAAIQILNRFLNRLPTITIRAAHRLRIWFTGDVLIPPAPQPTRGIQ